MSEEAPKSIWVVRTSNGEWVQTWPASALSAAEQRGRDEQREKDARLAQTMATGEDVTTGRLKAINIAAAIRTSGVTND